MRGLFLRSCLALAFVGATAGFAFADVQVNVKVSPDQIAQCGTGQLFSVLKNTGTKPIGVHLCFELKRDGTTLFGPVCGRAFLAAGETRMHEFTFRVPPMVPVGDYSFDVKADGSDGTSSASAAPFTIVAGTCGTSATPQDGATLLGLAVQSTGAQLDAPTPGAQSTWGQLKAIYR